MSVYKQKKSKYYWFKFMWNGKPIRKPTKQTNKRVAEQMEAAHRTALAKGEVGIWERKPVPTLATFIDHDFLPFIRNTKSGEKNTVRFYETCTANLKADKRLAGTALDGINHDMIQDFVKSRQEYRQKRRNDKALEVSTINRDLATLRRIFNCANEWGRVSSVTKIKLLSGENHRERALSEAEDAGYVKATTELAYAFEKDYQAALSGIRATVRGEQPLKPDAFRLRDVALLMLDAGLRPDECFRLKPENVRDGAIWIFDGKTKAARRRIPIMAERLKAALAMRLATATPGEWIFPAPTGTGHIEASSLRKQHDKAMTSSGVLTFELYILRHTCLTRWGEYMDPWKLHKYAGHADMKTTMRYVHPKDESMEDAMEQARAARKNRMVQGGHTSGHTSENDDSQQKAGAAVAN
ncbi:MAG: tyrosine-type recombinase/integrase [Acidobacteriia bacterium]|nr:tyrosine-type recombinase/integrase [Terriglobia bacterium]